MHALHSLLAWPHIALGFVALVAFWVPVATSKGSPLHRRAGVVFNVAMLTVSVSAFAMSALSLLAPGEVHPGVSPERVRAQTIFLSYLGLVSVVIVHNGWSTARLRVDHRALTAPWRRQLNLVLIGASVLAIVYGVLSSNIVIAALSPVGLLTGKGWLDFVRRIDQTRAWFFEHLSSMLAGGIAVHTAFLAGGGARFLPSVITDLGWALWLVPTAIGVPAILVLNRHYRLKFGEPSSRR